MHHCIVGGCGWFRVIQPKYTAASAEVWWMMQDDVWWWSLMLWWNKNRLIHPAVKQGPKDQAIDGKNNRTVPWRQRTRRSCDRRCFRRSEVHRLSGERECTNADFIRGIDVIELLQSNCIICQSFDIKRLALMVAGTEKKAQWVGQAGSRRFSTGSLSNAASEFAVITSAGRQLPIGTPQVAKQLIRKSWIHCA